MRRTIFAVVAALAETTAVLMMLIAAQPAAAQTAGPCARDFKQVCSDVTPGGGRLLRCYEERKEKMSSSCVAWAEGVKANLDKLNATCAKEIDAGCNFDKGDPFWLLDCLQSDYINLSVDCRASLNEIKWRYPKPAQ